ncbi:MAG: phytoene desaturase [Cytophagales bacterium]|nr:MAG: phytoene desaturase [Cytophagales bacterium]
MTKNAAIIGAGIAGIASAIRLAVKGYKVDVFEANAYPGGKLSTFDVQGASGTYRFDAGPSLFTLPALVEELFQLAGENPTDHFEYIRLPEICRYFWDDHTRLTAWADPDRFAQEIETQLGEPADRVRTFLKDSAFKYDITDKLFLHDSLHKASTWFNRGAVRGYLNIPRLGVFGTMNRANARTFSHPKVVQLFNRYATYNGSNPYQTPALLNIIPHLEYNIGAFFPKKGMVSITDSLVALAQRLGVTFHFNTRVEEIVVENGKAVGVRLGAGSRPYAVVLSNMDITPTYRKLMPTQPAPERTLRQPRSSSGLIFYWGVNPNAARRSFPELDMHNIFFSNDYRTEFDYLFNRRDRLHNDPTIYLNITAKNKPDDAPPGCENWFILLNAPANEGQDWDAIIAQTRQDVLRKLSHNLGVDVAPLIECEAILDPRTIEARTSSAQGALYGTASNNRFAAFMRHPNFSSKIKNLYFVGGSVHPGGGIPLCLLSAKIAVQIAVNSEQLTENSDICVNSND